MLGDDRLIEVNEKGDIVWEWLAADHIDEMGFAPDARAVIKAAAAFNKARGSFDWLHVNSATYVGPNQWFDKGDRRFAPDNVIISSREASIIAIVGRDGSIVWRMGPDFSASQELRAIRQIIGQHHPHLIPEGAAGRRESPRLRQRRLERLRLRQPDRARGTAARSARDLAGARDQPGDAASSSGPTRTPGSSAPTSAARSGCRTATR